MRSSLTTAALCAALLFSAGAAAAQEPSQRRPFCPDRPGKGDSTCVIDQGAIQLEIGAFDGAEQEDQAARVESWSAGAILVRYGLGPRTEVQAGMPLHVSEETTDLASGVVEEASGLGTFSWRCATA